MPASDDLNRICTIRIELLDSDPLIWREVEAPVSITLNDLHEIIQIAMGWESEHLWEFTIGKQHFSPDDASLGPFATISDFDDVTLSDILRPRRTTFRYLYDFGDSWEHRVIVTKIRPPETGVSYPRYAGGERSGPPEDCGGLYGFYEGLAAIARRDQDDEPGDLSWWAEDFDPDDVDVEGIEDRLRALADHLRKRPRRKKSKARTASPHPFADASNLLDRIAMLVDAFAAATPARPKRATSASKK
jgi:hypothetical protein